jgi:hypothetical protein
MPAQWLGWTARILGMLVLTCMTGWSVLAIYYSDLPAKARSMVAILFGLSAVSAVAFVRPHLWGVLILIGGFLLVVVWWRTIPPSNTRDWQPDVRVLPYATVEGNKVTIHNVRNCDYRTETDYQVHHDDRAYDLDRLRTADLFIVHWGSPFFCHTMLSFGFDEDRYVCISIETRKEIGEDYSAIKGFFSQFELTYIVADERDVVRLRTNFRRGEEVYLYRLNAPPGLLREVFLDYLRAINSLKDRPEWYNALTSNCTSNIRGHTKPYAPRFKWDWRLIVNGYVDEMVYSNGSMDRSLPFAKLKARSHINACAREADNDPNFSIRIREGLPGFRRSAQ